MWICGRTFQTEAKQVQRPEGVCLTYSRNTEEAGMAAVNTGRIIDVREVPEASEYQVGIFSRQLEL